MSQSVMRERLHASANPSSSKDCHSCHSAQTSPTERGGRNRSSPADALIDPVAASSTPASRPCASSRARIRRSTIFINQHAAALKQVAFGPRLCAAWAASQPCTGLLQAGLQALQGQVEVNLLGNLSLFGCQVAHAGGLLLKLLARPQASRRAAACALVLSDARTNADITAAGARAGAGRDPRPHRRLHSEWILMRMDLLDCVRLRRCLRPAFATTAAGCRSSLSARLTHF